MINSKIENNSNKNYHFFKLENDEINNNKIYLWTYWKLNINEIDKKNNFTEVFEIILSDGERLWNNNIKIKDISQYIKNIKVQDYYTLIKKALSCTKKDIKEKFIYNWILKDDLANLSIKLEISNDNDQNNFQYLLGSIDLLYVKPENRKKVYQLVYDDTANEYEILKNENELLINANNTLQKVQKEFSEQMDAMISDKNKLEEVYFLKFRELLNEKKRKIKNLMTALKKKEEIINEYINNNKNLSNNKNDNIIADNTAKNNEKNKNSKKENSIPDKNAINPRKRKRSSNSSDTNNEEVSNKINDNSIMDIDSKEQLKPKNNDDDNNNIKNKISSNNNNYDKIDKNTKNVNTNSDTDSDSDFNAFNLIPNVEVRSYTGTNKLSSLSSSVDLYSISTPTETKKEKQNKVNVKTPIKEEDESTTDDDIDKLFDLI